MNFKHFMLATLLTSVLVVGCKSLKKSGSDTGSGSTNTSGQTPATNPKSTTATTSPEVGVFLDKVAVEIRDRLKGVDVTRTVAGIKITFDPEVSFNLNSSDLTAQAQTHIGNLADIMHKHPQTNIDISGHADSTGRQAFNQKLSEKRASSFANSLQAKGVEKARVLSAVGYGATQPKASNTTPEGRRANRRIDAVITVREDSFK
jgi:outer membrane protein OmpA-like peptidoglycan-associated protein